MSSVTAKGISATRASRSTGSWPTTSPPRQARAQRDRACRTAQPLRFMLGHALAQAEPKVEIPRRQRLVHAPHGVEVIRGRRADLRRRAVDQQRVDSAPGVSAVRRACPRAVDRLAGHHTGVRRGEPKRNVPVAHPPDDVQRRPIRVMPSDDHADSVMIAIQGQPVVGPGLHRLSPHPQSTSAHAVGPPGRAEASVHVRCTSRSDGQASAAQGQRSHTFGRPEALAEFKVTLGNPTGSGRAAAG
jgi:hypothetical protein